MLTDGESHYSIRQQTGTLLVAVQPGEGERVSGGAGETILLLLLSQLLPLLLVLLALLPARVIDLQHELQHVDGRARPVADGLALRVIHARLLLDALEMRLELGEAAHLGDADAEVAVRALPLLALLLDVVDADLDVIAELGLAELLGLGDVIRPDLAGRILIPQPRQLGRVAGGDLLAVHQLLDVDAAIGLLAVLALAGETGDAEPLVDPGQRLVVLLGDVIARHVVALQPAPEEVALLRRLHVYALDVLGEAALENLILLGIDDESRNLRLLQQLENRDAVEAGDEAEVAVVLAIRSLQPAEGDRLLEPARLDVAHQLLELVGIRLDGPNGEFFSVEGDVLQRHVHQLAAVRALSDTHCHPSLRRWLPSDVICWGSLAGEGTSTGWEP